MHSTNRARYGLAAAHDGGNHAHRRVPSHHRNLLSGRPADYPCESALTRSKKNVNPPPDTVFHIAPPLHVSLPFPSGRPDIGGQQPLEMDGAPSTERCTTSASNKAFIIKEKKTTERGAKKKKNRYRTPLRSFLHGLSSLSRRSIADSISMETTWEERHNQRTAEQMTLDNTPE
jgi:hypothetical protein